MFLKMRAERDDATAKLDELADMFLQKEEELDDVLAMRDRRKQS